MQDLLGYLNSFSKFLFLDQTKMITPGLKSGSEVAEGSYAIRMSGRTKLNRFSIESYGFSEI